MKTIERLFLSILFIFLFVSVQFAHATTATINIAVNHQSGGWVTITGTGSWDDPKEKGNIRIYRRKLCEGGS